jgi:hypothetical protein
MREITAALAGPEPANPYLDYQPPKPFFRFLDFFLTTLVTSELEET